jgi:hypothetical protein
MRGGARGALFVHLRQFVLTQGGHAAWARVEEPLPPRDRKLLDGGMLVGRWYPVGAWNRLLASYVREYYPTRMQELARYTAVEDVNALFKLVLKLRKPEMLLRRAHALYARYFNTGKLASVELGPRNWRLILEAPVGEEAGPGVTTCTHGVSGWITQGLELAGVKTAQVAHVRCRFRRARRCEYIARW